MQCDSYANINSITVDNLNKTNGAVTKIKVTLKFDHSLQVGDTLHIELPNDIGFSEKVSCEPV